MLKNEIRQQIIRMTAAFCVLLLVGAWQWQFVYSGVMSNIYLNGVIFGTFFFGVFLVYRNSLRLPNELVMFDALREEYQDTRGTPKADAVDPNWRFARCRQPAIVFSPSGVLEQAYRLCSDEIARTQDLRISASTMNTLVEGIDVRLEENRSLVNYVNGLLVMLGLLGTFVGLMQTLKSVGNILGELDLSSGAGAEVISNLMTNLQAPLNGMATGFSSSLFGLVGTLTLGVMIRFENKASNAVKIAFEEWLSGLAQIEGSGDSGGVEAELDEASLKLVFRAARNAITATANLTERTRDLTATVENLAKAQEDNRVVVEKLTGQVVDVTKAQVQFAEAAERMSASIERQERLSEDVRTLDTRLTGQIEAMTKAASAQTEAMRETRTAMTNVDTAIGRMDRRLVETEEFAGRSSRREALLSERVSHMERSVGSLQAVLARMNNTPAGAGSQSVKSAGEGTSPSLPAGERRQPAVDRMRTSIASGLGVELDDRSHSQQGMADVRSGEERPGTEDVTQRAGGQA